jgi:hypothetical protein
LKQSFTTCQLPGFKNFESLVFGAFLSKTETFVVFLLALFKYCYTWLPITIRYSRLGWETGFLIRKTDAYRKGQEYQLKDLGCANPYQQETAGQDQP